MTAANTDTETADPGPEPERAKVEGWRHEQLLRAGYTDPVAASLAVDPAVDLHEACDLIGRGCPEMTAYLILT